MKKFFKKTEGFTLVELIVVIAILGILAGVGTVGYSGYIKKANMAADQTLVSALNTAFAAACIENGKDIQDITGATLTGGTPGSAITGIATADGVADAVEAKIIASFPTYFGENMTTKVKVAEIKFNSATHMFEAALGENGGGVYSNLTFNSGDLDALKGSSFYTVGVEKLLNKVSEVTDFVDDLETAGAMNKVYASSAFQTYFATTLGVTGEEGNTFQDKLEEYATKMNMSVDEARGILSANAAVLFAANQASSMSNDDIMTLLAKDNLKESIRTELNTTGSEGTALSHAALAYGMYYAYALDSKDETLINKTPTEVLNSLDEEGFKNYVKDLENNNNSDEDLAGFLGALNMISSSSSNSTAVEDLLMNGFSNDDLVAAIKNATGSSK